MTTTLTAETTTHLPNRWMVVVTIMLVAILEVLDSTIINVALPAMMPSLGANQEKITWVLTSYVVAAAVMLPLTGFLSNRLGQKKLLFIAISGFMISSFMCGMSSDLLVMVIFRLCQGAFGASLIPISQAVLRQTFPIEEQGKAMAIWGLGIMVAPVLGPTIGGFITEHTSWRWVFYINTPICLIGLLMTSLFISDSKKIKQPMDYVGVVLMFIGIGALQVFLDQGNSHSWFDSNWIKFLCLCSGLGLLLFIIRSLKQKNPVITMRIFLDRNFTVSTIMLAMFAGCVFGFITVEPIMLETLFHYTALLAGITMAPLGVASALTMISSAILMKKISVKIILCMGILLCTSGIFFMSDLDLNAAQSHFIIANGLIGFGMGFFMVPLTTYSLITLNKNDYTEGAGLFAYGRMLGSSIGISLVMTLIARETQINWNRFGGHINQFNTNLQHWLTAHGLTFNNPKSFAMLSQTLRKHASMVAFVDAYVLIATLLLTLLVGIAFLKKVTLKNDAMPSGH